MFPELKGLVLFVFGAFVIADTFLGFVQKSAGTLRVLYCVLGLYLVVRGLILMKPLLRKRTAPKAEEEISDRDSTSIG